jgi:hypothetical protein
VLFIVLRGFFAFACKVEIDIQLHGFDFPFEEDVRAEAGLVIADRVALAAISLAL